MTFDQTFGETIRNIRKSLAHMQEIASGGIYLRDTSVTPQNQVELHFIDEKANCRIQVVIEYIGGSYDAQ